MCVGISVLCTWQWHSTPGSSGITIFPCECCGVRWVGDKLRPPELWCVNVQSFAPQINMESFLRSRMFVHFLYVLSVTDMHFSGCSLAVQVAWDWVRNLVS